MIPSFDWFAFVATGISSTRGTLGQALLITASASIVGMGLSDIASGLTSRFSGDGDQDETDGGDPLAEGDVDDGFDESDDEFGDIGGWDDDELGDLGDDDEAESDLSPRIDELENEIESLSSTMGTVRSENEAISETVEDIEDNIRKLLEIYEMVTRGVNPFVDDAPGGGGMGGAFDLFDHADDEADDLDPDVADADPDSFFEDDFDDAEFDDDFEDEFDDEDGFVDEETSAASDRGSNGSDGGDGKTFEELKSEYDAGDEAWDDAGEAAEAGEEAAPAGDPQSGGDGDVPETDGEETLTPGTIDADIESEGWDQEPGTANGGWGDVDADDSTAIGTEVHDGGSDGEPQSRRTGSGRKPYLQSLPSGFGAELLVIEWLSYLEGHSSTSEALRAIRYYETIGWVGHDAAEDLQGYLYGLSEAPPSPPAGGGTQLTIDHHTNSLHYIGKLGGTDVDVERLEWSSPGRGRDRVERRGQRGIQR